MGVMRIRTPNSKYSSYKICPNCGIAFTIKRKSNVVNPYCKDCKHLYVHANTGRKHSLSTRKRMSEIKKSQFASGKLNYKQEQNPRWKNGLTVENGRISECGHFDHPFCDSKGRVCVHRLIVEKSIGRYLQPNEIVHHIDGNPHNNKPSNLILCDQSYHMMLHNKMRRG